MPTWNDTGAPGPQSGYSGTDYGYNVNPSTDPLAQLYYGELNKIALYNTSGNFQNGYGILGNNGGQVASGVVLPFSNVKSFAYWLGTEYAPNPDSAWHFFTAYGIQNANPKNSQLFAWAVSPGQVASVPAPGAIWLFSSTLLGFIGFARRQST